jgi:hypothetical protein
MHEFLTRFTMNYPSFFVCSNQHNIGTWRWYRSTNLLSARAIYSPYHDSKSCQIDISDLIRFVDKGFTLTLAGLSAYIVSWT